MTGEAPEGSAWASIRPLTGKERNERGAVQADVTHEMRMRYRAGITPRMRIRHEQRTFEIESVLNYDERDRELILALKEDV